MGAYFWDEAYEEMAAKTEKQLTKMVQSQFGSARVQDGIIFPMFRDLLMPSAHPTGVSPERHSVFAPVSTAAF